MESSEVPNDNKLRAHAFEQKRRTGDVIHNSSAKGSSSVLRFSDFGLSSCVLKGLLDAGFCKPSPVQCKAIPLGKVGLDLIVQAKSGTGKTVVFAIIVLEMIDFSINCPQALILSPTREVAYQTHRVIQELGCHIAKLNCSLFVGGVNLKEDLKALENCKIAVGTPGRIKYLIESRRFNTSELKLFVLDEADMLLGGQGATIVQQTSSDTQTLVTVGKNTFPATINWIWWSLPEKKQVLALSATYSEDLVVGHLPRYMKKPVLVRLVTDDPSLLGVAQYFYIAKIGRPKAPPNTVFGCKVKQLCHLLSSLDFRQCLVFSNYHTVAEDLCAALKSNGWPVSYISSVLGQEERFKAYESLRAFQCRVLVSTDLTARGVDAENVDLVVHMEVPWEHETYLHRVGRAGRFGSHGASVVIVADANDELQGLKSLCEQLARPVVQLPEPIPPDLTKADSGVDIDCLVSVSEVVTSKERQTNVPITFVPTVQFNSASTPRRYPAAENSESAFDILKECADNINIHSPDSCPGPVTKRLTSKVIADMKDFFNSDLNPPVKKEPQNKPTERKSQHHHDIEPLVSHKQIFFYHEYCRLARLAEHYYDQYNEAYERCEVVSEELAELRAQLAQF